MNYLSIQKKPDEAKINISSLTFLPPNKLKANNKKKIRKKKITPKAASNN